MEGAQKFSFHRSFPRTDVTKSVDQGAQLVERERRLESKADAKADDARKLLGARVDVARRDHDAPLSAQGGGDRGGPPASSKRSNAERGGVHHGGDADGENGTPSVSRVRARRWVADARARDDAGIRELDGGADAPEALRRQRVNGNDKVGAHGLHRAAHELGGLQSRCAEDAGRQHADIRERTEGGAALQVARGGT